MVDEMEGENGEGDIEVNPNEGLSVTGDRTSVDLVNLIRKNLSDNQSFMFTSESGLNLDQFKKLLCWSQLQTSNSDRYQVVALY